jgi:WD40 repeat protein
MAKLHQGELSYSLVVGTLQDVMQKFGESFMTPDTKVIPLLRKLLGKDLDPAEDHEFFRHRRSEGSCNWILSHEKINSFLHDNTSTSCVMWVHGSPGVGKSVLTSSLVEHIKGSLNFLCQVIYCRPENPKKLSTNFFLRSLAYQLGCQSQFYGKKLAELAKCGEDWEKLGFGELWRKLFVDLLFLKFSSKPLIWCIDGYELADSPLELFELLRDLSSSRYPVRIIIFSHWTKPLFTAFDRIASNIKVDICEVKADEQDIARYVDSEARAFPGDSTFQEKTARRIIQNANGNFLWTQLVTGKICECRTKGEIDEVLKSHPKDLDILFGNMVANLSKHWRDGDLELATAILQWTTCTQYPLPLSALSRALEPRSLNFLDFKDVINQVCGDFVEIDHLSRITTKHGAARNYLTKGGSHELRIDIPSAHRILAMKCLSILIETKEALDTEGPLEPLLQYAATCWPHHLSQCHITWNDELLLLVSNLLKSRSFLHWIYVLSLAKQLDCLVDASKALRFLALTRDKMGPGDPGQPSQLTILPSNAILRAWDVDLLRISTQCEKRLLSYPKEIYHSISAFCPVESLLQRQLTSSTNTPSLHVVGFSNLGWSDLLFSSTVEMDFRALRISCTNQFFATSNSSNEGNVRIYSTSGGREEKSLHHGDRVLEMKFNNSGSILATYGYETVKIWKVATGEIICSLDRPNYVNVLAMGFQADDRALLTYSNDGIIRIFRFFGPELKWETLRSIFDGDGSLDCHNFMSPTCASFNTSSNLLAVGSQSRPISVWNISTQEIIGGLRHETEEDSASWKTASNFLQIAWHPTSKYVFGINAGGFLSKWDYENRSEIKIPNVNAIKLRCSHTGSFLVTIDDSGMLKVWRPDDLSLIYHRSCSTTVNDLAISPDGSRIYDLRDSDCNIWGPAVLAQLAGPDEGASSDSKDLVSSVNPADVCQEIVETHNPVEVLAVSQEGSIHCAGYPNGTVKFFKKTGEEFLTFSPTPVAISHLDLSADGRYLAVVDEGSKLYIYTSFTSATSSPTNILATKLEKSARQLLFNQSSSSLLVAHSDSLLLWPVERKPVAATRQFHNKPNYRWISHPYRSDLLMGFGPDEICILQWHDLEEKCHLRMITGPLRQSPPPDVTADVLSPNETSSTNTASVSQVFPSGDGSRIVIQILRTRPQHPPKQEILVVSTLDIDSCILNDNKTIHATPLSKHLNDHVTRVFGCASKSSSWQPGLDPRTSLTSERLVFLDRSDGVGSVCSLPLKMLDQSPEITCHFPLPEDWQNPSSLELVKVTKGGRIFVPKDGQVPVIIGGLNGKCEKVAGSAGEEDMISSLSL